VNAPHPVPTTPVASRRALPRRAALAALIVVAITLLRPWGDGRLDAARHAVSLGDGPARPALAPPEPATATPAPSLEPDQIACDEAGWTIVSLDRLGPWTVRSWVPVDPVLADGPADPRIRPITLYSTEVLAVGACTPSVAGAAGQWVPGPPARFLRAWSIVTGRATPMPLRARRAEATPTVATLYRPVTAAGSRQAAAHWPGGTYVIELTPDTPPAVAGKGGGDAWLAARTDTGQRWFVSFAVRESG